MFSCTCCNPTETIFWHTTCWQRIQFRRKYLHSEADREILRKFPFISKEESYIFPKKYAYFSQFILLIFAKFLYLSSKTDKKIWILIFHEKLLLQALQVLTKNEPNMIWTFHVYKGISINLLWTTKLVGEYSPNMSGSPLVPKFFTMEVLNLLRFYVENLQKFSCQRLT